VFRIEKTHGSDWEFGEEMQMIKIEKHKRVNDILLGPLERPVLKWFAARMPAWITPDSLTALGVMGALVTSLAYILSNLDKNFFWLASFGLLVNWFGDSLDGTLARYRRIERPSYGFYIDHIMDTFSQAIMFLGLGLSPYISFNVACMTLIGLFMLEILIYLRTSVVGEFKISYGGLGPTELRVVAILLNTAIYLIGQKSIQWTLAGNLLVFSVYDIVLSFVALLVFGLFVNTAWKQARLLAQMEK
jgi:archaetidylinositol phosphate synthase